MNHDATHCLDFCCDCPETCYRAELDADLRSRWKEFVGVPLSYAHLYGTEECKRQSYLTHEIRTETHECVKPTQQWIPVSERLPENEKKTYWVCTDTEYQCECRWTNANPFWADLTTDWHWNKFDTPQYSEVLAWMPLPEPWKDGDK